MRSLATANGLATTAQAASNDDAGVALVYDYSQIDEAHRGPVMLSARRIKTKAERAKLDLISVGEELTAVKERLEHGQFQDWCTAEFDMSYETARRWMNVAKVWAGKHDIMSFLSPTAMIELAAPSVPEAARVEVIEQAQANGRSPSVAEVKATVAAHRPPKPAPEPTDRPLTGEETVAVIYRTMQRHIKAAQGRQAAQTWLATHFRPSDYAEALAPGVALADEAFGVAYSRVQQEMGLRQGWPHDPPPQSTRVDDDEQYVGVAVVGNGPIEDDAPWHGLSATELRSYMDALKLAVDTLSLMQTAAVRGGRTSESHRLGQARLEIEAAVGRWED